MSGRFLRAAYSTAAILLVMVSGTAWAQDELFVASYGGNSITVYARTADGNVAPIRTLVGAATGLNVPHGLAADTANNELVVVNGGNDSVTVYALTANGNVAPLRTLVGAATGLSTPYGLAVDTVNNELAVANQNTNSVTVYARTANGNVAPLRTIAGVTTGLSFPFALGVDTINNELVVVNQDGNSVTVYARTANGNVAPLRTIAGAATGLSGPAGLAVDPVNNELGVVNQASPSVRVFGRTANGNVAPLRTIGGAATGLSNPFDLAVDTVNNELVVANFGNDSIRVYARAADGSVAPLRTLAGAATGLNGPMFLAITTGAQPVGLVEDAHATGATISNVNNVLEPGETILVNASWKNVTASPLALTGTASAFDGPAGATYTLLDTAADYGTIAPGATADSFSAGGPSYRLFVSNPVTRPAAHWDATFFETLSNGVGKTWTLHIGDSFTDVPTSNVSYASVENIFHNGITTGCAAGLYCPAVELPRWQMAIFLARSILGSGVTIPTSGTVSEVGPYDCTGGGISLFTDVAPTNVACPAIHYIYSQGITTGCGAGIFCPNPLLPRWQMAIFLARSMLGPGVPIPTTGSVSGVGTYDCSSGGNSLFTDVPTTNVACPAIHYIYSQSVTTGCGAGIYCPNSILPRWQMAIFLVRAFHMPFLH